MANDAGNSGNNPVPVPLVPLLDPDAYMEACACECTGNSGGGSGGVCECGSQNGGGGGS